MTNHVLAQIHTLYGELPEPPRGVVHVVACVEDRDARLRVITIGPDAPKSETDFFVLQLARARADAVLTTGQILRDEPELSLAPTGAWGPALSRYRNEHLGKSSALTCAILSGSGDLPSEHSLWSEATEKLVLTHTQVAPRLASILSDRATVIGDTQPSARRLLEILKARGAESVSIEAGPTTVRELYEGTPVIDELWLSIAELTLPGPLIGKPLPERDLMFAGLRLISDTRRREASGVWRFQRWVRG